MEPMARIFVKIDKRLTPGMNGSGRLGDQNSPFKKFSAVEILMVSIRMEMVWPTSGNNSVVWNDWRLVITKLSKNKNEDDQYRLDS